MSAAAAFAIELSFERPGILIVDDDSDLLETAREFFTTRGYEVDTALTPEEAEEVIEKNGQDKYKVIATDVNFGDLSSRDGEHFVMDNPALFGKAKRVIISGGAWLTEERRRELASARITFVAKSPRLNKRLEAITQAESQRSANDVESILRTEGISRIKELTEQVTGSRVGVKLVAVSSAATGVATAVAQEPASAIYRPLSELLVRQLKSTLIKWLGARSNPDKPILACGSDVYSPNQMIEHVEKETEVGLEHIRMMLGEFDFYLETGTAASP